MEPLSREEIKIIFADAIAPLITELKANKDSHEKEIERLTKQSTEHYSNFDTLREEMQKQVSQCQAQTGDSMEKSGIRMGELENKVTIINEHVETNTQQLKEIKDNKQFSISQWLVVAGVVAMIILGVLPYIGGR